MAQGRARSIERAALLLGLGVTVASAILLPFWAALLAFGVAVGAFAFIRDSRRPLRLPLAIVAGLLLASAVAAWVIGNQEPPGPSPVAHYQFARSYTGPVWARIAPASAHLNEGHTVILCWGPKIRPVNLRRLGPKPQSLVFEKGQDNTPIQVRIKPPATITFGEGQPPDGNARDVNDGWKRGRCKTPAR